jgi:hypothetical protein
LNVVRVLLVNVGEAAVEVKLAHLLIGVMVAAGPNGGVERARPRSVVVDEARESPSLVLVINDTKLLMLLYQV